MMDDNETMAEELKTMLAEHGHQRLKCRTKLGLTRW